MEDTFGQCLVLVRWLLWSCSLLLLLLTSKHEYCKRLIG
jgi:hypothetical protein